MTEAFRPTSCACEVCEVAREARRRVAERAHDAAELIAQRDTLAGRFEELTVSLHSLVLTLLSPLLRRMPK